MLSKVTQNVVLLGITAVVCYIALVSLSNSHSLLGLIALLASLAVLAMLGLILAGNLAGPSGWRSLGNSMKEPKDWWDRLL